MLTQNESFYNIKQVKKLKYYMEKIFELVIKGKLRHCKLRGIDTREITVPFTND